MGTAVATGLNPFTDEYVQQELAFIGPIKYRNRANTVRIVRKKMFGPENTYLGVDFFTGQFDIPIFQKRDQEPDLLAPLGGPVAIKEARWRIWMSITPMEVQSLVVPICRARGVVGTSGLGLGYFPMRAAAKDDVERVDVYEIDPDVIKMFKYKNRGRPELKKIKIIQGDVYTTLKDKTYDFFLADHYAVVLPDDVTTDYLLFWRRNNFGEYRFWCEEKLLFWLRFSRMIPDDFLLADEIRLFQEFAEDRERLSSCMVKGLNYDPIDEHYLEVVAETGARACLQ